METRNKVLRVGASRRLVTHSRASGGRSSRKATVAERPKQSGVIASAAAVPVEIRWPKKF